MRGNGRGPLWSSGGRSVLGRQGCDFVKRGGLALSEFERALGTVQTGPKTVAKHVAHQFGLAVHNGQSAFCAVQHALAAAVALVFINFNDQAFHEGSVSGQIRQMAGGRQHMFRAGGFKLGRAAKAPARAHGRHAGRCGR